MIETYAAQKPRADSPSLVRLEGVSLFDVGKIFDCGQCFRFDPVKDSRHRLEFAGCAAGKYISVAQDGDTVFLYNVTLEEYEAYWKYYLGLNLDYGAINADLLSRSSNPALRSAIEGAAGIRILLQEPWETVCSFILSQNNNIPRIKKLVSALSRACGEPVDVSLMDGHIAKAHLEADGNFYSFPSPSSLLSLGVEGLRQLKTGFRAKYLYDAAQKFGSGEIDTAFLRASDTESSIAELCKVNGIGRKVASCALLFGFGRLDAFPVDVWIKKVMEKHFDAGLDPASLGPYAGIAQQYLFYYERYLQK